MEFDKVMSQYKDFTYKHEEQLQKDFDEKNKFKTNVRGVKIRGVYQSKEEANARASKLHKTDSNFHVFVGQIGYWLPWDPCADKIDDEYFVDDQLNDLMQKYKENNVNKDIFYEEQKRDKIKASQEERLRQEKKNKEKEALENKEKETLENKEKETLENISEDPVDDEPAPEIDVTATVVNEPIPETDEPSKIVEEPVGLESKEPATTSDLEKALNSDDPWIQRKNEESN